MEELKQEDKELTPEEPCQNVSEEIIPEATEQDVPEQAAVPCDFLGKYASAAFHDLAVKRGSGDKEAAEKIRRYIRHIEKKDAKAVERYLHTENANRNLETLRKGYAKMQGLSWVSLILCAAATFAVIGLMIFKPELMQKRLYQVVICGGAVLFAALTWIFSGIGGRKAHRMTELDLLLRVKDLPTETADDDEAAEASAEEDPAEAAEAPEEAAEEAAEEITE